mgnify:CR=1 FL=1
MKHIIFYKSFLMFVFYCCCICSCAQNKRPSKILNQKEFKPLVATSLKLIKESCTCGSVRGFRYRISYDNRIDTEDGYCNYSYDPVLRASDSLKIQILADLLEAIGDTSLCCKAVKKYGSNNNTKAEPRSKNYNLQIDALFTFNFIAFGVEAKKYAPYPVLYDTLTNEEINNDFQKINEVALLYKKWYKLVSKTGFTNYTFPLINTRYRWYGAINKKRVLDKLPTHPKVDNLGHSY